MSDSKAPANNVIDLTPGNLDAQVRGLLDKGDMEHLRRLLADQHSPDVADVLERLSNPADRNAAFRLLSPQMAAEVIEEISHYTARELVIALPHDYVGPMLRHMEIDDLVEILGNELRDRQEETLAQLEPGLAQAIRGLLNYPKNSAGRMMTTRFVRVGPEMTAGEILAYIKSNDERYETVSNIYVVEEGRLIGVTSLRQIVRADSSASIRSLMEHEPISVTPETRGEDAARVLGRYDFLALPVASADGQMLGIITVDDAIDVLTAAQTADLLGIGGVHGEENAAPYFTVPILKVIRQRLIWLILLFVGGSITSGVLEAFSVELGAVVALSFYIPLLIGTGGNTGSQTVSMIIRGMTTNDIKQMDVFRVVRRELVSGLILGVLLGLIAFGRVLLQEGGADSLPLVVAASVIAVCAWSNVIAAVIPMIAKRLKIDPALISAPLISTTVDATGLLIYMLIAKALLTTI